jgi:4-oxalocrotonate tautomerase
MPLVTVKVLEGVFSAEKKQEIIRRVTDAMVDVEGENLRPVTWVVIEEVKSGEWGMGGNCMTTFDVKRMSLGSRRVESARH